MKTIFCLVFCSLMFFRIETIAQTSRKITNTTLISKEEDIPIMFRFEPNYLITKPLQREALLEKIKGHDTLPICDKKRLRFINALYNDLNSEKVNKAILVQTRFEDYKGVTEV